MAAINFRNRKMLSVLDVSSNVLASRLYTFKIAHHYLSRIFNFTFCPSLFFWRPANYLLSYLSRPVINHARLIGPCPIGLISPLLPLHLLLPLPPSLGVGEKGRAHWVYWFHHCNIVSFNFPKRKHIQTSRNMYCTECIWDGLIV